MLRRSRCIQIFFKHYTEIVLLGLDSVERMSLTELQTKKCDVQVEHIRVLKLLGGTIFLSYVRKIRNTRTLRPTTITPMVLIV